MSFENWLNLWKYKHWKLVEAQLHTWYALFSAFCVWVFLYFFCCCCCLFIFPFFSVVGFPFHPQFFFFRCSIFFFCLLYSWFCYLYVWNPIYKNQPSIHTKRYVRHVWDIYWTNFTSLLLGCLLLCYFVENSEFAGRKTALKCGLFWTPSTRIRRKKMGFQKCQDSCGHGL